MATFLLNNNLTQIAAKRLSGKAMTNSKLAIPEEAFGSSVQTLASTVFAEVIPNEPNNASNQIYLIQSESNAQPGTVMLVDFDVVPIGSSKYTNIVDGDTNADLYAFASNTSIGENTTNTYHAYILKLTGSFQADLEAIGSTYFGDNASTGTALGSTPFVSGFTTSGSLKLQIVPEYASTLTSGNPYVPKISQLQDPEDFVNSIPATSPQDMYLDPFAGILFIQDPADYDTGTGNVPGKVRAFIYVGKYQDEVTFTANDVNFIVSGSDEGFAVGNDDTINFVSGSAGITVESNSSAGTITIGESTDNVTFNQITASIINADKIEATEYIVSSSITYMTQSFSSGSTIFGDTNDDTHQFTGSIQILHTGSGYGFQMSGSNFLIDYGDSGSVTLGEYNIGQELAGIVFPITGSGLIISQSFTDEATHHNMVKIGETELVDISGSYDSDSFLINVREKALIISSSNLDKPVAEIEAGNTSFYGSTTGKKIISINGDNPTLGNSDVSDTTILASANFRISSPTTRIRIPNDTPIASSHLIVTYGNPFNNEATLNDNSKLISTPLTASFPYLGGAVTASAVSSSGLLFAGLSGNPTHNDGILAIVYDTGSGQFYYTGSYGAGGGDTTDLEASASQGIHFSTGSGTGTSIGLMQTASFTSSGAGLSVDLSGNTFTYTLTPQDVFDAFNTANTGSFTASYANTASFVITASHALTASKVVVERSYENDNLSLIFVSGASEFANSGDTVHHQLKAANSLYYNSQNEQLTLDGIFPSVLVVSSSNLAVQSRTTIGVNSIQGETLGANTTYGLIANQKVDGASTLNFGLRTTTINVGTGSGVVNFNNDITVAGSASIEGDLIVKGAVTSINTTNLNVEDQFILLNSGSNTVDGGIIIRQQTDGNGNMSGSALFLDSSVSRFAVAKGVAWDRTTEITQVTNGTMEYLVSVSSSATNPESTAEWGGGTTSYGQMFVNSATGEIFIYG